MATVMNLNLLPSEAKFQAAKIRLETKTKTAMMIMVVVWILSMISVFGAGFAFNTKLQSEQANYQKALGNYKTLSDSVMVNQGLKYKAKMVGKALAARFEYGKAFETVNSLFPDGIKLDNFAMDPGGFFKVNGTTTSRDNVNKLEDLIQMVNSGGDPRFVLIKLTSLSVNLGDWKIGMEVTLK